MIMGAVALLVWATVSLAQSGPLRIEITDGVIEPLSFAVPDFQPESPAAEQFAGQLARVIASDLTGTALFREIPSSSFIAQRDTFGAPVKYADWRAINAAYLLKVCKLADFHAIAPYFPA